MENFSLELTKRLFLRFSTIYGTRFTQNYPTDELIRLWWEDWSTGLRGVTPEQIKAALEYCKLSLDRPPSLSEFRRLCLIKSGVPETQDIIQAIVRQEFNHPLTKMIYEKVGSWAFKNETEKSLVQKIKNVYEGCLSAFLGDPDYEWRQLEKFKELEKAETKLLEGATVASPCGNKRLVGNYYLDEIRAGLGSKNKRLTEEEKQNVRNIMQQAMIKENPDKGKSLSEWYDNVRLERQAVTDRHLQKFQQVEAPPEQEKTKPKRKHGSNIYHAAHYWSRD